VHEGRRLERLPRLLVRELRRGQLPQLVINEGQQFGRGARIAQFDLRQDPGDIGHGTILKCPHLGRNSLRA
jgi:hypothetical protein